MWKGARVLVTGGASFIGSHLVKHLLKLPVRVYSLDVTDNPKSYYFLQNLDKHSEFIKADINNFNLLKKTVLKIKPDYIFHLAAETLVENSFNNPLQTLTTNIMGSVNILEIARLSNNVKGVIFASSDKAYGKLKKGKYVESNPLQGDHPYEVSKSAADLIASSYFKSYNLPVVVVRSANVYGEGDLNFSRIIPGIMKSVIENSTLALRSNGKFIRDYIYVEDAVNAYLTILKNFSAISGEAFNISSGESLSVLQVISIIQKALGKKINYQIANSEKNEIPYQSLNFDKITGKIGWKPQNKIVKVINQIYTWYRKFYDN